MLAYDLANIKPHPHLSGHQTIQQSFLNCELFEATSLSIIDNFFQALYSCRDLSRGWRNQLNLGIVPKCGQSRLQVSHSRADQRWGLLREVTDKLGHGSRTESQMSAFFDSWSLPYIPPAFALSLHFLLMILFLLSPSSKYPCDYIEFIQIIQDNLSI